MRNTCFAKFESFAHTADCLQAAVARAATGNLLDGDAASISIAVLFSLVFAMLAWTLLQRKPR